jgi:flagellar basal body-associated protein FliL
MGNSTGSMFYLFAIVIVVYIVGASIYQVFLWFKKWQEKKNDEKFSMDNGAHKE